MKDNEENEERVNPDNLDEDYQKVSENLEMKLVFGEEDEEIGEDRIYVRNRETGEERYVPFHPLLFRKER